VTGPGVVREWIGANGMVNEIWKGAETQMEEADEDEVGVNDRCGSLLRLTTTSTKRVLDQLSVSELKQITMVVMVMVANVQIRWCWQRVSVSVLLTVFGSV
jgi:hypothetical protein